LTAPADLPSTDARTRLREAALDRFGRQGIAATSTREIIAEAGLRNPSAITYYFGSKAQLVDDLLREINHDRSRIIQQQVAMARESATPAPEKWVAIAVDAAISLLESERGCLLVRVWADRDAENPEAVEAFLAGEHPLAVAWREAVAATLPHLPPGIAVIRCTVLLRMLQFFAVRRARRMLEDPTAPIKPDIAAARAFLVELGLNVITPPTALSDADLF
jgi:AcrR family transcriptional regulator